MKEPRIRVSGILENNGEILFVKHRKNNKEYYLLPGGGVDFGETFEVALKREFLEEVNLEVEVDRMCIISEGVDPTGEKHIINFVFIVKYKSGVLKLPNEERIVGAEYLNRDELDNYTIYPNMKNQLKNGDFNKINYIGNIWE